MPQRPCQCLLSALLLACGAGRDSAADSPEAASVEPTSAGAVIAVQPTDTLEPSPVQDDTLRAQDAPATAALGTPRAQLPEPSPCSPPPGVSGSPRTVAEVVALMNALPRPTSLACFLESLDRPLDLYLTSSELSLQPADGAVRPRTFIVLGPLVLSVVSNAKFISRLEIGHRTAPGRSVKGEVLFPLTTLVTASSITERIRIGNVSICGGCHGAETRPVDSFFVDGAFESAIAVPLSPFEVDLESLRDEAAACDRVLDPERCAQLSALFDHGEVRRSTLWDGG